VLDELPVPAKEGDVEKPLEVVVVRLADSQTSGLRLEQGCCQLEGEKSVGLVAVAGQILGAAAVDFGDDLRPGRRHRLQHVVRVVQGCAQQGSVVFDSGHRVLSVFCA
jgi:hypothetical protein